MTYTLNAFWKGGNHAAVAFTDRSLGQIRRDPRAASDPARMDLGPHLPLGRVPSEVFFRCRSIQNNDESGLEKTVDSCQTWAWRDSEGERALEA